MPIDKIRNNGTVFRKKLNAKRPKPIPAPIDPFFSDVILLLPMSGSGTNFVDYSLINNVMTITGTGLMTVAQGNIQLLYGENTGNWNHKLNSIHERALTTIIPVEIFQTDDIVMEWSVFQASATPYPVVPIHCNFIPIALPAGSMRAETYYDAGNLVFYNELVASATKPCSFGTWNDIVMQYIAADAKIYCYINGNQVLAMVCTSLAGPSVRFYCGTKSEDRSNVHYYELNFANVRITRANRYGNNPTIPRPDAPWPLQ